MLVHVIFYLRGEITLQRFCHRYVGVCEEIANTSYIPMYRM